MIDHVALYVSDIDRSRRFYERALAPLGYTVAMEMEGFVAFGPQGDPRFAIRAGKETTTTAHVAFTTDDRASVDAFHAAATGPAGRRRARPAFASTTIQRTTPPSSKIPTATTSRLSATSRSSGAALVIAPLPR